MIDASGGLAESCTNPKPIEPTPQIKTIIVDDHALFNDGLALILKESGLFAVLAQVYDSRQALYVCGQVLPDLVLVDYNMPHLDGLAVVEQLQQVAPRPRLVVISMYAQLRERKRFIAAGVDGYLAKTTPAPELLSSLGKIMAGERLLAADVPPAPGVADDFFALRQLLTKREYEIALGLKAGQTTEQLAQVTGLSYLTVETHRKNINAKLKLKDKQAFYAFLQSL